MPVIHHICDGLECKTQPSQHQDLWKKMEQSCFPLTYRPKFLFSFFYIETHWNHIGIQNESLGRRNCTDPLWPERLEDVPRLTPQPITFLVWLLLKFWHLIIRAGMYQVACAIQFIYMPLFIFNNDATRQPHTILRIPGTLLLWAGLL